MVECVTVDELRIYHDCALSIYRFSCGDSVAWSDYLPPKYCPYCGREIDYTEQEAEGEK